MGEDERLPPLTRRVPNENRGHKPAGQVGFPQLPDEVVARMLAAVRADAAAEATPQDPAAETAGPATVQTAEQQSAPPRKATPPAPSMRARKRTAHAARQATERQRAAARQRAEDDRRAEDQRQAEDDRRAEQQRRAEDDWRAEQNRQAEQKRQAEQSRRAELEAQWAAAQAVRPEPAAELPKRPAHPWTSRSDLDPNADTDEFPVVPAADEPAKAAVSSDPARLDAAEASPAPVRPAPALLKVPVRAAVSTPEDLGRPLGGIALAGRRRRRRLLTAAAAAVVIAIGGSVALALKAGTPPSSAGAPALRPAVVLRDRAAMWIATQVSHATTISCDPVMCGALESYGFPLRSLQKLMPGGSPLTATLVVATAAVRQQLGAQLSASDAPGVLARFGSAGSGIQVRAVAQHGAADYWSAIRADVQLRKLSWAQMLSSSRIGVVTAQAGARLAAGQVDSRVLVTLSDLASKRPIDILSLGAGGPRADLRVSPLRSAEVEQVAGEPNLPNAQFISAMRSALGAQAGPFVVASARQVRLPGGQIALRIEFSAPEPLGLLGGATGG
jgi:hypothetical protein